MSTDPAESLTHSSSSSSSEQQQQQQQQHDVESGSGGVPVIKCLYCSAEVYFTGVPARRYEEHLVKEHNILRERQEIVLKTLEREFLDLRRICMKLKSKGKSQERVVEKKDFSCQVSLQDDDKNAGEPLSSSSPSALPATKKRAGPRSKTVATSLDPLPAPKNDTLTSQSSSAGSQIGAASIGVVQTKKDGVESNLIRKTIPWNQGCEYRCQICGTMFFYSGDLRRHIKDAHATSSEDYLDRFEQLETKAVMFECRICRKSLKRNVAAINKHLSNDHNTDVEEYGQEFGLTSYEVSFPGPRKSQTKITETSQELVVIKKEKEDPEPDLSLSPVVVMRKLSPSSGSGLLSKPGPKSMKRPSSTTSDLASPVKRPKVAALVDAEKKKKKVRKWYQGIEFQCRLCSEMFYEGSELTHHIRDGHGMDTSSYKAKFKRFATKESKFTCQICEEELLHTELVIAKHLNDHGMDMRTYGLIYKDTKTEEEEHIDGDATNHEIDTKDEIMDCSDETETVGAAEEPPLYSLEEFLKGRCQFRCLICSFTTSSTDLLWGHVSKIHSVSMEKYKATHGSAYIVKSVKIECVICFRHVRHEPGSWGQHCLSEHGLGLEKFFRKYYCSADKAERPVHGEGDCGLDLAEDDDVDHGFSVWWASGNKYGCKICGKECTNVHSMYQHLQSQHKMNAGDYRAAHGDLLTKVEQFKCQYCQESLNFDRRMVTSHLAKHKISPKDYFKYYLNMEGLSKSRLFHEWQYGCEYHCRICKKKIMTYGLLENHLSADHGGIGVAEYEKCYGPMMFREVKKPCAICNAELVWYPLKVKQHLKTHGCSLAIYYYKYVESMDGGEEFEAWKRDGNLFTCKVCRKTASMSQSLVNHITRDHGMSRKDYVEQYGAIRTESGVHKCVICSKEMLFDLGIIRQHVSGKHSTTLREYFMKHVKKLLRQQCDEDKVTETFEEWKKGGVVYQCRDCEKTVRSKNGFLYHIRTIHELSEDEYRLIHGNQLYEPVDHVCKVCGASVDFDPSNALPAHLINRHKLSVREYFERHVANKTKTFVSPKKNNSTINPGSKQLNRSEDEEFQKWKNQCGYNCKVCGLKYVTAFGLKTHLEVKHKLSLEEYRAKHGPVIMTNVVKKKCPVPACNKTILYQAQKLKNHLLLQHALELRDCFRQHVENKLGGETTAGGGDGSDSLQHPEKDMTFLEWVNQCEFKCHLCYKDHTTSKALSIHIANVHEITTEDYKAKYHTLMSKEVRKKCPVPSCGQTILFASFRLKSHFRADHRMKLVKCFERYVQSNKGNKGQEVKRTLSMGSRPEAKKDDNVDNQDDTNADIHKSEGFTKWKNQCEFNCQICGQVYCSGVGIGRHIKKTHDMSIDNYKKRFGSTFSKRVSDKCPVPYCQSQVLYHTYDLRAHLESKHSLGLLDCYVQYVMSKNPIPSKTDGGDESVAYDEPEQQPAQEQGDTQGQNNESTAASDLDMSLLDTDQFQKWKNQCQFDCKVCQNEYVSQLGLLLHMKQLHGLDSGEYKAQYGSLCSKLVQDKCPVLGCCKQITFHSRAIKRHMAVHSMTPEKCYLKYVVGNTERSLESPMIVPPSPGLSECSDSSRGRKKTVPVRRLSRQSEGSDLVERNKGGVRRRAYKNYRFPWNQCSRHCHVCGYKCPGYGALAQHLKTKHDLSMVSAPTYVEGDIDIQHTCLICQTNIKFSAPTVSAHIKDKHQLLMLEYEARFAQDLELVFASLDTTENAAANNADLGTIVIESVESQATHENEIVIKREVEEEEEEVSITEGFWYGQEDDEIPGVEKEVEFEVTGEEDTI